MQRFVIWNWLILLAVSLCGSSLAAESPAEERIDFTREVRPILSDRCFHCHGPDEAVRQGDLRLDLADGVFSDRDGAGAAIMPGAPEESLLYQRITGDDDERMPPVDDGPALSTEERELMRRWIAQGAEYVPHWSFVTPSRPELPDVANTDWPRNEIDHFILSELERHNLSPVPEADPAVLIRRVSLDLTGLPPTPEEINEFLADSRGDAYERLVDRLLDSPRYGERMAVAWLDAARYADTNGYQLDTDRTMWRWRDWVIGAFNRNLPFDQFTVEQLAGDLLPDPDSDQLIATGFNRNHRVNSEGGSLPEEFLVENIVDRIDATATVWLGLTMGCARCHDHKYDPISQREFYEFFAFFHNLPEEGTGPREGNAGPFLPAPTADQRRQQEALQQELAVTEQSISEMAEGLIPVQREWEQTASIETPPAVAESLELSLGLDGGPGDESESSLSCESVGNPLEYAGAILDQGGIFTGDSMIAIEDAGDFDADTAVSMGGWVRTRADFSGPILSRMGESVHGPGYRIRVNGGTVRFELLTVSSEQAVRVKLLEPLAEDRWQHLLVTYDGSRRAKGVRIYVDGARRPLETELDTLEDGDIRVQSPFFVAGDRRGNGFVGRLDDVRVYRRELPAKDAAGLAGVLPARFVLNVRPDERSLDQSRILQRYYLERHAPADYQAAVEQRSLLQDRILELSNAFPTSMVMQEMAAPRETFVLVRGAYDQPSDPVSAGTPRCLPQMDAELPRNRLGLARWLVDPRHPLTARVAVNRYWQMHFGTGLVETSEDFGSQGALPSHMALLDWLATEFVRLDWDIKALHQLIVTSATYRQQSQPSGRAVQVDPRNRLLARAPRLRLSGEMIRDQALYLGGLLVEHRGGPSVRPYQPEGLWAELTAKPGVKKSDSYVQGTGTDLYRRSLYTFWKRTIPPPGLAVFDAPSRETCVVRRSSSMTPLQALTTLNDVTFVEASRGFAQRMIVHGGSRATDRVRFAWQAVSGRLPQKQEQEHLLDALQRYRNHFAEHPSAAAALVKFGESPRDESIEPVDHAAYTMVASLLLNLDATITRE